MARYDMSEVKIDGNYPVDRLLELDMDIGVNKHGLLSYGGYVSEEIANQYVHQKAEGQTVSVLLSDELEFCGHIKTLTTEKENDYWYVNVKLITSTQLMDIDAHDRFFQDVDRTYEEIIAEAYSDSNIGNIIAVQAVEPIHRPVLQYKETDWAFTLRMAGKVGAVVIPNVTVEQPQVLFGIPERQAINETNEQVYKICRTSNYLKYKLQSDNRYKLGDCVIINSRSYVIMQKQVKLVQGEVVEHYVLGEEFDFSAPFYQNNMTTGLELEGVVLNRHEQRLQVLLDIDKHRNNAAKVWFSYSPVTNNGMYNIPLVDEKVRLQWQSSADHDVFVVRPVRKNSSDMPHNGERHFFDENRNHLKMLPDMMEYRNPVGNITWFPDMGFDIVTSKTFEITALRDVQIKAGGQIQIFSPERISTSKIELEKATRSEDRTEIQYKVNSCIDMLGREINMYSEKNVDIDSEANYHTRAVLPDKLPSFEIEPERANKLIAAIPRVLDARNFYA